MFSLSVLKEQSNRRHGLEPLEYEADASAGVDARELAEELRRSLRGEVRFDDGSRALYATDASNYRQTPIGVVVPRDAEDVMAAVAVCRRLGAPILSRGGGTSLAGQCCNVAVVLDMSRHMNRILEIDAVRRLARVEPGVICDHLTRAVEKDRLMWGPAPATHQWCTFGGMIGNNSCGINSQVAGRTQDNVEELEILTYAGLRMRVGRTNDEELERIVRAGGRRGEIYAKLRELRDRHAELIRERYPKIPRRVSGYGLDALLPENGFHVARALVGSESTCVTILEAMVRLSYSPPARSLLVIGFEEIFAAGDRIAQVAAHEPIGLEGLDRRFIDDLRKKGLHEAKVEMFPPGNGYLLVEFGGESQEESDEKAERLMEEMRKQDPASSMKLFTNQEEKHDIWVVRESGLGATAHVPGQPENHEGWEDSAVPPERMGDYLRDLTKLFEKYGYQGALYGHWGQGCIHTRINFDLKTAEGVRIFRSFIDEAGDLVARYGGSFSGEHGDGQSRAELLPKIFGRELVEAFEEFKSIWDPQWKMNPGKVVRPYRITENLRFGPSYRPAEPETYFKYPDDGHSFAQAMERCVGVGKCRREEGGTMCPSYMVTREEMHTTRGRARLLFEMLQGDPLRDGWRSEQVKEALDLCLSCKGCKGDCPVHVDVATYKAEFLAHYYKGRVRPRHAYAFGLIHVWARLASMAPGLVNLLMQTSGVRDVAKWMAEMAPQRRIPAFAPRTFKSWFRHRAQRNATGPPVILWPDTFNNYFHPDVARAAVEVLEGAGFRVDVPMADLCCGRPLYDYGMLDRAERWLRQILEQLRPQIQAGVPVVVLEPSCCSVLRDELTNLMPHDLDAQRLRSQTFTLGEFLAGRAGEYRPPRLEGRALLHGHCHQKALMRTSGEMKVLKKMGLEVQELDSGCCGMAGAFGYERGAHYDVAVKCGERVLIPAVREADDGMLIIADGFSCQEQIAQMSDRRALHLAQVLQMAMHQEGEISAGERPEGQVVRGREREQRRMKIKTAALVACGMLAGAILMRSAARSE